MSSSEAESPPRLPPLSVSVREACRLIGVGNTTLWAMIKDGRIRTTRVGRRRLVIYESLSALFADDGRAAR